MLIMVGDAGGGVYPQCKWCTHIVMLVGGGGGVAYAYTIYTIYTIYTEDIQP